MAFGSFDYTCGMGKLGKIAVAAIWMMAAVCYAGDSYVYASKSGKRYHKSGCSSLPKVALKLSLQDAKKLGLTPCKPSP